MWSLNNVHFYLKGLHLLYIALTKISIKSKCLIFKVSVHKTPKNMYLKHSFIEIEISYCIKWVCVEWCQDYFKLLKKAAGKLFQNFYCFRLCMLQFYGSHLWRSNLDVILFLERLAESLRTIPSSPGVQSAVFLCFRVILIRMSPQHVTSLWPLIITEMVLIFSYLEQELSTDSEEWR